MHVLRRAEPLLILLIAAGILLPLSPIYRPIPSDDPSVYLYVGQRMLEGGVPYLDAWDHKQPLTYFLFALGQAISPHALWGMWLIELVFLCAAGIFGLRLLEKLTPHPVGFVSTALALLALTPILWGYSLEELALPFQILTLYALARILLTGRADKQLLFYTLIGALTAACFFLKQSLVAAGVSALIYLVLRMFALREWRILRGLAAALGGFCATAALVILYLALNGALPAYRDAAFGFNLLYSNLGPLERFNALLDTLERMANYPALFIAFALWITCAAAAFLQAGPCIAGWITRRAAPPLLIAAGAGLVLLSLVGELDGLNPGLGLIQVLLILGGSLLFAAGWLLRSTRLSAKVNAWLHAAPLLPPVSAVSLRLAFIQLAAIYFPISLLLITLSGRDYVYYFILLIPASWLVFGMGSGLLLESGFSARAGKLVLLAFALALAYNPALFLVDQYRAQPDNALPEIAAYIQKNTRPDQTILAWGKDTTYVYYSANRRAPSRYFYQAALTLDAYNARYGATAQLIRDLQANPPALFLFPGASLQPGECSLPTSTQAPGINSIDEVFQFFCQRYTFAEEVDGFQVYQQR